MLRSYNDDKIIDRKTLDHKRKKQIICFFFLPNVRENATNEKKTK